MFGDIGPIIFWTPLLVSMGWDLTAQAPMIAMPPWSNRLKPSKHNKHDLKMMIALMITRNNNNSSGEYSIKMY